MKPSIRYLMLAVALAIGLPNAHGAEELILSLEDDSGARPKKRPDENVVELTVHPAAPPRAALEHRLLPSYLDKTYGNAAPMYCKAILMARPEPELWEKVHDWINGPLEELPLDEVRKVVSSFQVVFEQLTIASRRSHCDWGLPLWETDNPYGVLLPELQESRNLARIVALRARLAIAEGDVDEAIRSLRVGFTLARHVGEQSTLIGTLVGSAIAGTMADQVAALVRLPDAPNLYWSLTALPSPLVDPRDALEMESVAIYLMFPQFDAVKTKKYTPAQWEAVFDEEEILAKFESLLQLKPAEASARKKEMRERLKRAYPLAKRELAVRGYSEEDLDRMPVTQVVVLHTSVRYDELCDGMFKWFQVPYWQAREGIQAAQKEVEESGKDGSIGLGALVLPGVGACRVAFARTERGIAALRCVEAIRFYAAVHDGKLPASLDDVTEVPLPVNPFTGKPFECRLEGKTAVLEAASGGARDCSPRQYRITLAE